MHLHSLGYLGVTSPKADEWPRFAGDTFGLEVEPGSTSGEPTRVRWDDRPFRLAIHEGPEDRLAYLGWETSSPQDFQLMVEHANKHSCTVHESTPEERYERRVRSLVWVEDPLGFRHEFFAGPVSLDRSFRGGRATSSFITGSKGLGHAVLIVPSHAAVLPFYEGVLGLKCSDVVNVGSGNTMIFLRCNSRHHSIALIEVPRLVGLQHLMVESADLDDVGKAYDLVQRSEYEIASTMGRHTGDEQLSFYTRSPSGFDLEFGCDAIEVVEAEWSMRYFDPAAGAPNEVWGHHWQQLQPQTSIHPVPESASAVAP